MVGNAVMSCAMALAGPASLLGSHLEPTAGRVYTSTSLVGLAWGLSTVSTYARSNVAATELGYPKDANTAMVISGESTSIRTTSSTTGSMMLVSQLIYVLDVDRGVLLLFLYVDCSKLPLKRLSQYHCFH